MPLLSPHPSLVAGARPEWGKVLCRLLEGIRVGGWRKQGGGWIGALCSGGWRMAPTPSIIWQPLALWLTRPLRPETECSISSEPSPPTLPSPLPLAQLLWPQEWEQQLGWGKYTREMFLGNTQRNAQTQDTPAAQVPHLKSQRKGGLKSSDVAHVNWWAPHGPLAALCPTLQNPHFNWFCSQQG